VARIGATRAGVTAHLSSTQSVLIVEPAENRGDTVQVPAVRFRVIVFVLTLAAAFAAREASATSYCEIRKTEAGFAALRAGPSDSAKLLQRMTPGDEVLLGQGKTGDWVEVTYWRGGRFHSGKNPQGDPPTAKGWMRASMIAEDSCG